MNKRFQIWLEHHIDAVVSNYEGDKRKIAEAMEEAKVRNDEVLLVSLNAELLRIEENHKGIIKEESARLDKFLELLSDSSKKPKDAENEAFEVDENFYLKIKEAEEKERKRIEQEKRKRELARKKAEKEKAEARQKEIDDFNKMMDEKRAAERREHRKKLQVKKQKIEELQNPQVRPNLTELKGKFYLEKGLSAKQQEALFAKGYKRLKVSPFGDTGAAYYWVRTRYNESKEHAFFCYLIETELKRHNKKVEMNVTYGPDIVFKHKDKEYCFDVETGKNLRKHPETVENKFMRYKKQYSTSFILITDKSLKYKYSRYGTVVTRSKLREILRQLLLNSP